MNVCPHDGFHLDATALELCLRPRLDAALAENARLVEALKNLMQEVVAVYDGPSPYLDRAWKLSETALSSPRSVAMAEYVRALQMEHEASMKALQKVNGDNGPAILQGCYDWKARAEEAEAKRRALEGR